MRAAGTGLPQMGEQFPVLSQGRDWRLAEPASSLDLLVRGRTPGVSSLACGGSLKGSGGREQAVSPVNGGGNSKKQIVEPECGFGHCVYRLRRRQFTSIPWLAGINKVPQQAINNNWAVAPAATMI